MVFVAGHLENMGKQEVKIGPLLTDNYIAAFFFFLSAFKTFMYFC